VYRLVDRSSQAAKIYSSPLTPERAQKISILIRFGPTDASRYTAWPSGLVFDEQGRPRGHILPVVERGLDIHNLYTPSSRRKNFPDANWRFLTHVGTNVARAFSAMHDHGLVIGDVNQGSILVLRDGTVRLIDVDSFQVPIPGQHPLLCTVAVPLFLPPELHGAPLESTVRTPNHDAFGLAIIIFQLLMLGRHPYAGRFLGTGDMPIERAINENRFAFGARASTYNMIRPPNTVGLEILPPEIASLFETAFAPAINRQPRPSAKEWVQALGQLSAELVQCPINSAHQYSRFSSSCPWCSFEQSTSVVLFGISVSPSPNGHEAEYRNILRLIAAVPRPTPLLSVRVTSQFSVSHEAHEAAKTPGSWTGYAIGGVLIAAGMPLLAHGGLLLIILGVILFLVGVGVRTRRRSPWVNAYRLAKAGYAQAENQLAQANRFPSYAAAIAAAAETSRLWDDLPRVRAEKHRQLEANKHRVQLQQFLQAQLIESASIKGIGPSRIAMLSAYGIDTAADVNAARVQQVPQIGPVLTDRLVAWRQTREHSFVYDPSQPLPRESIARVEKEMQDVRLKVLEKLRRSLRDLQSASADEPAAAVAAAQRLHQATIALGQAEANVLAATGKLPA
jgi:DNA-binding helix-hairpin-helix protein with protein kinase domain